MKKIGIGVLCIMLCALTPVLSKDLIDCVLLSQNSHPLTGRNLAQKGIFPPNDPDHTAPPSPPPGQNQEAEEEKPLQPPEEPSDTNRAPGPSPNDDRNQPPIDSETDTPRSAPRTTNSSPSQP